VHPLLPRERSYQLGCERWPLGWTGCERRCGLGKERRAAPPIPRARSSPTSPGEQGSPKKPASPSPALSPGSEPEGSRRSRGRSWECELCRDGSTCSSPAPGPRAGEGQGAPARGRRGRSSPQPAWALAGACWRTRGEGGVRWEGAAGGGVRVQTAQQFRCKVNGPPRRHPRASCGSKPQPAWQSLSTGSPAPRGRLGLHAGSAGIAAPGDTSTRSCLPLQSPGYGRQPAAPQQRLSAQPSARGQTKPRPARLLSEPAAPQSRTPASLRRAAQGLMELSPQDCPVSAHGIHHVTQLRHGRQQAHPRSGEKPRPPTASHQQGEKRLLLQLTTTAASLHALPGLSLSLAAQRHAQGGGTRPGPRQLGQEQGGCWGSPGEAEAFWDVDGGGEEMPSRQAAAQPLTLKAQPAEGKAGSGSQAGGTAGAGSRGTARKRPGSTRPCSRGARPRRPPSAVSLLSPDKRSQQ